MIQRDAAGVTWVHDGDSASAGEPGRHVQELIYDPLSIEGYPCPVCERDCIVDPSGGSSRVHYWFCKHCEKWWRPGQQDLKARGATWCEFERDYRRLPDAKWLQVVGPMVWWEDPERDRSIPEPAWRVIELARKVLDSDLARALERFDKWFGGLADWDEPENGGAEDE